jgi:peptidoglycan/xylan/chitin deacetylase (PgdA/CDA1 family)
MKLLKLTTLTLGVLAMSGIGVAKTPILTYHDFIDHRDSHSLWFDCTTGEFEAQIQWLTAHGAHFVTLDQIFQHLTKRSPLPPKAIALTAADGYEGFFLRAVPILQKFHVPLTMFVHTKYVGGTQGRAKMTWEQLESLQRGGLISIQSQTVTHAADMGLLTDEQQAFEMHQSKADLESHLGSHVHFVAYPNGKFNAQSEAAAEAAGYSMAFSEVTAPCERSPSIWAVNRYVHTKWRKAWRDSYGKS